MIMVALSARVRIRPNVVFRVLGEEAIVLGLDRGEYFGLDQVGTRIWQLLESHDLADVAAVLTREFEVARAQAESDVVAFVDRLIDRGLLEQDRSPHA
jgi:hypothetical protein